jgi:hypothetical protein
MISLLAAFTISPTVLSAPLPQTGSSVQAQSDAEPAPITPAEDNSGGNMDHVVGEELC